MIRKIAFFSIAALVLFACGGKQGKKEQEEAQSNDGKLYVVSFFSDSTTVREQYFVLNADSTRLKYQRYHKNGAIAIEGIEEYGKREGEWKSWDDKGAIKSSGFYVKGIEHGTKTVYYPNGNLRYQGVVENNQRVGEWKFWDKNGELVRTENYTPVPEK